MSKRNPAPRKRKTSSALKQNQSGSASPSKTTAEKKHVNPIVTTLILVPLVGLFLYFAWGVVRESMAPVDDGTNVADVNDPDNGNTIVSADSGDELVDLNWDTPESRSQAWSQVDDAASDGWSTEHFTNEAIRQFDKLKKLIKHPEDISVAAIEKIANPAVDVGPLRPAKVATAFQDASVLIKRPVGDAPNGRIRPGDPKGHDALVHALQDFSSYYSDPENLRLKIKVFRVEKNENTLISHQTVEAFGSGDNGLVEENLTWIATWDAEPNGSNPTLTSLVVDEYECAERSGNVMFSDCTESVMGHTRSFRQQLLRGFNYWLEEAQFQEFYALPSNPGIAIGDVNNDGLEDIFVCQEMGLPCLLYLQQPDGSVKDFSKESNLDLLQNCRTALIVDWNNDGNNDIALAVTGGVVIASGDGSGRFNIETIIDCSEDIMVLSAADYDMDGMLDLFVGVYWADLADWQNNEVPVAGFGGAINATDGGQSALYRNMMANDQWQFQDVTEETGFNVGNYRYSQAASWEDFDNDGDPDLYVANDFGFNNLFRNDLQEDGSRRFVDVSWQAGVQDQAAGMSVVWGDYDRDGWTDLYVSNMYSYAGNRITFQDEFKSEITDDVKSGYQRFARGNTFFRNPGKADDDGHFPFEDLSLDITVNRARWAWGSRFIDLNNDGWEDIVVANGFITSSGGGDL